jgi:quercetin dioxygenase-like cupin family protein
MKIRHVLLMLSCHLGVALAQSPADEQALVISAEDTLLKWGACPPFLPKGCRLAVLHGDPAKDNVDVLLEIPGNTKLPRHWHTSAERMVLVAGELEVTYEGQKTVALKPGSYAYGPARKPHEGLCVGARPCVLFIAFESPLDAIPVESPQH